MQREWRESQKLTLNLNRASEFLTEQPPNYSQGTEDSKVYFEIKNEVEASQFEENFLE